MLPSIIRRLALTVGEKNKTSREYTVLKQIFLLFEIFFSNFLLLLKFNSSKLKGREKHHMTSGVIESTLGLETNIEEEEEETGINNSTNNPFVSVFQFIKSLYAKYCIFITLFANLN